MSFKIASAAVDARCMVEPLEMDQTTAGLVAAADQGVAPEEYLELVRTGITPAEIEEAVRSRCMLDHYARERAKGEGHLISMIISCTSWLTVEKRIERRDSHGSGSAI
jgi:hypothetical protein